MELVHPRGSMFWIILGEIELLGRDSWIHLWIPIVKLYVDQKKLLPILDQFVAWFIS